MVKTIPENKKFDDLLMLDATVSLTNWERMRLIRSNPRDIRLFWIGGRDKHELDIHSNPAYKSSSQSITASGEIR